MEGERRKDLMSIMQKPGEDKATLIECTMLSYYNRRGFASLNTKSVLYTWEIMICNHIPKKMQKVEASLPMA